MPINITITDVSSLTAVELQNITNYLSASVYREDKATMLVPDEKGSAVEVEIDNVKYFDSPKPRKKRMIAGKAKGVKSSSDKKFCDELHIPVSSIEEKGNITEVDFKHLSSTAVEKPVSEEPRLPETNFTYNDLISYILENTREKKINHDQIMTLVGKYGLSSLNELEKFPRFTNDFYNDLVTIVNA